MWILAAQSAAYIVGAISWIYAERGGFLAYGRYMLRFARDNRRKTKLLTDKDARERVEPFLTARPSMSIFTCSTRSRATCAFCWRSCSTSSCWEPRSTASLPVAYCLVFLVLFVMQWTSASASPTPISKTSA